MNQLAAHSEGLPLAKRRTSVVIVDDTRTWRLWLRAILEQDPRFIVVGEAGSAEEARDVIKRTNPDVLTLDVEMPGMNGLRFLEHLMRLRPMPVVMFSGHTGRTSAESIRALSLGAIDCVLKINDVAEHHVNDLRQRIFQAAEASPQFDWGRGNTLTYTPSAKGPMPIILMGASTGGVLALERTLMPMPVTAPPIVIAQHMPQSFLESFVRRLGTDLPQNVSLAQEGMALSPGDIVLSPSDGVQTGVEMREGKWFIKRLATAPEDQFIPSVDRLFHSARAFAGHVVAAVLTGIGSDGAAGAVCLEEGGGDIIVQDEASSVVYGMPRVARERVASARQVPLNQMAQVLLDTVNNKHKARTL